MEKFLNKYRIPSARLKRYDYGSNGLYFVTICTKNRKFYFGKIATAETHNRASLHATQMGHIAFKYWVEIPTHYPFVELDEFVIMPDHMHGILKINKPDYNQWHQNQFSPQSKNLAAIIRGFKSSTKRFANLNNIEFDWQPRYHDRIIKDKNGLTAVRKYIKNNPQKWLKTHNRASIVRPPHL